MPFILQGVDVMKAIRAVNLPISVLLFSLLFAICFVYDASASSLVQKGRVAPNFEVVDLNGNPFKLSDLKGKPVLLNFWATWCPPCKSELPEFERFFEEYGKQVHIVAINLTLSEESKDAVKEFVKKQGLTFPIYLDVEGSVVETYLVRYIPTSYFLDKNLVVKDIHIGPLKFEDMVKKFEVD